MLSILKCLGYTDSLFWVGWPANYTVQGQGHGPLALGPTLAQPSRDSYTYQIRRSLLYMSDHIYKVIVRFTHQTETENVSTGH